MNLDMVQLCHGQVHVTTPIDKSRSEMLTRRYSFLKQTLHGSKPPSDPKRRFPKHADPQHKTQFLFASEGQVGSSKSPPKGSNPIKTSTSKKLASHERMANKQRSDMPPHGWASFAGSFKQVHAISLEPSFVRKVTKEFHFSAFLGCGAFAHVYQGDMTHCRTVSTKIVDDFRTAQIPPNFAIKVNLYSDFRICLHLKKDP